MYKNISIDINLLKKDLHKEMIEIYKESKKIGYNPVRFIKMLTEQEGYQVARTLIQNKTQTDGFTELWNKKRLDLTVENLILKDKFIPLFSHEEREVAKKRLIEHNYRAFRDIPMLELEKSSSNQVKFNKYLDEEVSKAIYEYLFNKRSHRTIDELVLNLDSEKSLGYQTMAILHYLGLKNTHKGMFEGLEIELAIMLISHDISYKDIKVYLKHLLEINNIESTNLKDIESVNIEEEVYYKDGLMKYYHGKRYERNPQNRKRAIEIHGLNCKVCGFNFEDFYGENGESFIEVHHIKPVSHYEKEEYIDPSIDLVPVCSNCHRMLHRNKEIILSIEELKRMIYLKKKN